MQKQQQNNTKFSVIMPSYLGDYSTAATNREVKLKRAVNSVINQTYSNWELIIIADGCTKTVEIVKQIFQETDKDVDVRLYMIRKQRLWGGQRNYGIQQAKGDYIIYLDTDDYYNTDYLESLNKEIDGQRDWYYLSDIKWFGNNFAVDLVNIDRMGKCGTSNIIHRKMPGANWPVGDYKEDYQFIKTLQRLSDNYSPLATAGYVVCHVPGKYDI